MPIYYLRSLTGKKRSPRANVHLGWSLAFIAGAMNAGGFLAVKQYTSHMTGIVSSVADGVALGNFEFALAGIGALLSFTIGAAISELMINWARNRRLHSEYALSLMFEAMLLLAFGALGEYFHSCMGLFVSITIMLLCFIMGLQNAIITKISAAVIRTTHVTGIVTDIGIELGRMCYWNRTADKEDEEYIRANRNKLSLLSSLLLMFFIGGVVGAYGFKAFGYFATIPLSLFLTLLALVPVLDDVFIRIRRWM
ncbi:MAG: YoaK family protein [Burkholderiaceae bacterium]|nr:YoaK family protein [Burkholderiaceae bacterium]